MKKIYYFPKIKIYLIIYSLELFKTFIIFIYVFLPIITLDIYIHNLLENLRMTRRAPIILTMPSSRSTIKIQVSCHYTHLDSIVICY
jgi:type III secretory pathway component EscR